MFGMVYKPSTLAAGLGIDTGVCDLPRLIGLTRTVRVAGIMLIFLFLIPFSFSSSASGRTY
jgi:hypothetical protein